MPNPVKPLPKAWEKKTSRKLTPRQKGIVSKFRRRFGNRQIYYYTIGDRLSVHAPMQDVTKRAKKRPTEKVKRYPHAYDTKDQLKRKGLTIAQIKKLRAKKGKITGKRKILFP